MLLRGLKILLIAIAALGVIAVIAIALAMGANSSTAVLLAIVIAFLAVSALLAAWCWSLLWAKQGRDAATVLHYLDQAVRLNLPLPRMVRAIGATKDLAMSKRMEAVAADLERGGSLADALGRVPRIPLRVLDVISAAEGVGQLPQALNRLMEQRRESIGRRLRWIPFYRLYPLVLGIVFILVSTMFLVFVVPKFESLFHDFKTQMPGITQSFLSVARFVGTGISLLVLAILALLVARTVFGWWRGAGFGLVESWGEKTANYLPVVGSVRRYRALADAFDYCADAIDAGRPFDTSAAEAARLVANRPIARKLQRWADATADGMAIPDAARRVRMPSLVSGLLGTAMYANGFVAVLKFLARYYRYRHVRAVALIEASAAPVIAIVMGILVLWLSLSMLAPLITLIQTLSSPAAGPHL